MNDKDITPRLNHLQMYLAEEFVDEYHEGHMTRRELLAKVLGITGGVASAATLLLALGCAPPAAAPTAAPTTAPAKPAAAAATTAPTKPAATAAPTGAPTGVPAKPTGAAPAGTPGAAPTQGPARSPQSVAASDPAVTGMDVTFPSGGATIMAYMAQPRAGGPSPAVMICHENQGLQEHFRDIARRFAKAGFVALAVDLLSRDGGTARVEPNQIAGRLTADPARNVADFQAAFNYLNSQSQVQRGNIGMTGFCFGGGVTFMVAAANPDLKAAVPFYGANPPLTDVPRIRAAILAFYGETDTRITSMSEALEQAMRQNNKTFEKVVYPGAGHAFFNDTRASWNQPASEDSWRRMLDWFKRYLV